MPNSSLSTKEVAVMLGVVETTMKRWADEGLVSCIRTLGGHRRFALSEVVRFAEANGYTIAGSKPPSMMPGEMEEVELWTVRRSFDRIAQVFRELAQRADRTGILDLLLYLYKNNIALPVIADEVIRPAFQTVGTEWESGKITAGEEHAASQATLESLIRMSSELHRKRPNGMSVLCACPGEELHDIGLRALAYSLETEGWKVHYIGANTPLESIASLVEAGQPELVCLSVTMGKVEAAGLSALADRIRSCGGKLLIGGSHLTNAGRGTLSCDHSAGSIQDAIAFTRDVFALKPGPKKGSAQQGGAEPTGRA